MESSSSHTFVARAPVRADIAGGGSDAPPFSVEYGGAVVNCGITQFVHARVQVTPDSSAVSIRSEDYDQTVKADSLEQLEIDGALNLLKGLAKRMAPSWGFRLTIESDVPPGCGLGSSGAVGVACVRAFDAAMGVERSQEQTAELGNSVEREDLGMAGGCQDSYGAALGGMNYLKLHKGGAVSPKRLKLPDQTICELERRCVLVYTGEVHLSESIHEDIKRNYALPDSPTLDAMKNLRQIAKETREVLIQGDIERFGHMLSANWAQHRRLHESCNSETLQRFFSAAEPHTVGGRVCGAGGGGCALFVVSEGERRSLEQAFLGLGGKLIPFRIDPHGVVSWRV